MKVHHHRLFRARGRIDREDVQSEAVLVPQRHAAVVYLRAAVSKRRCAAHALPACRSRRWAPTQVADGRCGEGNPAEGAVAPFNRALELTRLSADDGSGAHTAGRCSAAVATAAATTARRQHHQQEPGKCELESAMPGCFHLLALTGNKICERLTDKSPQRQNRLPQSIRAAVVAFLQGRDRPLRRSHSGTVTDWNWQSNRTCDVSESDRLTQAEWFSMGLGLSKGRSSATGFSDGRTDATYR